MIRIDEGVLEEVGLGEMAVTEKQAFIDYAEEELEVRVGRVLSEGLSDEKISEFEGLAGTPEAVKWLEKNIPDFREQTERIFEEFKEELRAQRAEILGKN